MKATFDYDAAPMEWATRSCPGCDRPALADPIQPDRYGYLVSPLTCPACGLVWLHERMTAAAYADFYASGAYRRLVSAYHRREITDETIRPEQREYARKLSAALRPWLRGRGSLLDVGGATGEVASAICDGMAKTVLDPAPAILDPALDMIQGLAEDVDLGERRWDVILLCQSIDHLLDPFVVLAKLRQHLAPGGIFWVDALDYDITQELKIDHPFNFTARSLERLLDRTGWVTLASARWNRHVGFICTA